MLSKENLRLCLSPRAPSGAGRSPYHSEPSIEAPDSSTASRQVKPKPPQTRAYQDVRPGLGADANAGLVGLDYVMARPAHQGGNPDGGPQGAPTVRSTERLRFPGTLVTG